MPCTTLVDGHFHDAACGYDDVIAEKGWWFITTTLTILLHHCSLSGGGIYNMSPASVDINHQYVYHHRKC